MTRIISSPVDTVLSSGKQNWGLLLELGFDSGTVNVWSGVGEITADSRTWQGLGDMGSISGVTEVTDLADVVLRATLSHIQTGLIPELVDEITLQNTTGRPFEVLLVFFNDDRSVIDVIKLSNGFIDAVQISTGAETGSITFDLVSESAILNRQTFVTMTNDAQQDIFPGDKGFQFVTDLDEQIVWGNSSDVGIISGGKRGGRPQLQAV